MDGKELANYIDEQIKNRNLIKTKTCKEIGITAATLSYWRTGKYEPTKEKESLIIKYFDNLSNKNEKEKSPASEDARLDKESEEIMELLGKLNPQNRTRAIAYLQGLSAGQS